MIERPVCQGECGKPIPVYENVPDGYESPEIWKLVDSVIAGKGGMRVVKKTLCIDCYRTAWKRIYPREPLPI